jgi:hypothetical protein
MKLPQTGGCQGFVTLAKNRRFWSRFGWAISAPNALKFRHSDFERARQFLHVSVAQGEAEIKPDRVLNDLGRKAMTAIRKLNHGSW